MPFAGQIAEQNTQSSAHKPLTACPESNGPKRPPPVTGAVFRPPFQTRITPSNMKIFSHQAAAYQELLLRAQTYFEGNWRDLPIKTRWASLVLGPTGAGKSALGMMLSADTAASLLRVNVSGWMPSGAHNRAVAETISTIIDHIHRHQKTILFLDEIEKIWHQTSWNSYIKGELFEILDGNLPTGAKGIGDGGLDTDEEGTLTYSQTASVVEKLRSSTFILGAGTFQDFYEEQSSSAQIGFHPEHRHKSPTSGPTADIIAKKLPRELLNRFDSSLLFLPPLEPHHYQLIAQQAEQSLPAWIQPAFRAAAAGRINQAIAARSGCRFIEEALSDALKHTKAPTPTPDPPTPEPDPCDW